MYYLYSHNDLDGVGCGILAKCAFGDKVEVRYNSVSGLNIQVERFLQKQKEKRKINGHLFITDLSIHEENEKGLDEYAKSGGKLNLIDHHKTALHFNKYPWGLVQVEEEEGKLASATSLFYAYLVEHGMLAPSKALAEFVELVRQYDTWEWDKNENLQAKRLNDLFFMTSIDEFEAKMIQRIQHEDAFRFDEFEQKILDMEEEKIGRYISRKKRELVQTFVHDLCVGIVHAESYHSELGNELGRENSHMDYIVIVNMGGRKVSLRTIHDDVDVSEIAARYGGGGHAKAAGCTLSEELYRLYVAEPFQIEPLQPDAFRNFYNLKNSEYGSLYESRQEDQFFLFPFEGNWKIELNGRNMDEVFPTFEDAERFVKRNYAARLVRDESYVNFLRDYRRETRMHVMDELKSY